MLTARAARPRSFGGLIAVTAAATAVAVAASPVAARADSVRSDQQWVLDAVHAPVAWTVTQGSGVTVAVIDSGVVPTVDDLAGSVTIGPDLSGISTPSTNPHSGMHGTWMASLIAGHGHGNGDGISGIAPLSRILSIRVLPDKDPGDPAYKQYQHEPPRQGQRALAHAITYAVAQHVSVISMSLGYGASSRVVRAALQDATRHNVVVVASSGNFGNSASGKGHANAPYSFPADYPGVLGVAAVNRAGKSAKFSSDNLSVQVAAPGVNVPAQGSDGGYWLVSGTSPACALTAGVAALIRAQYPHLPPALVIRAITSSTQNRPPGGYDDRVGFGTVDAAAALIAAGHLTTFRTDGHGVRPHEHFGGGPSAIPPSPIRPRGPASLVVFCLLALACLVLTVVAAARLKWGGRSAHAGPPSPATAGGSPPGPYQPSRYEPVGPVPIPAPTVTGSPASGYPANGYPANGYPGQGAPGQWNPDQDGSGQSDTANGYGANGYEAQAGPAQPGPAQSRPAQPRPAQPRPTLSSPAQAAPAQASPAQASPAAGYPVTAGPATGHPAQEWPNPAWPDPGWPAAGQPGTGADIPYGANNVNGADYLQGAYGTSGPDGAAAGDTAGPGPYAPGFPRDGGAGPQAAHQEWPATSWTWDSDAPSDGHAPPAHTQPGQSSPR